MSRVMCLLFYLNASLNVWNISHCFHYIPVQHLLTSAHVVISYKTNNWGNLSLVKINILTLSLIKSLINKFCLNFPLTSTWQVRAQLRKSFKPLLPGSGAFQRAWTFDWTERQPNVEKRPRRQLGWNLKITVLSTTLFNNILKELIRLLWFCTHIIMFSWIRDTWVCQ